MSKSEGSRPEQAEFQLSRRTILKGAVGVAGLAAVPSLLAACGSSATSAPAGSAAPGGAATPAASVAGSITFGSNYSDAVPKKAMQDIVDAFTKKTGIAVTVNTTEHGKFQDTINAYLQGTPDDAFCWFAGYRMQFFAAKNLATDISDVWTKLSPNFSDAFKAASTGADGKQYFVPLYNYPWVVTYRKSFFSDKGYTIPKTIDDFVTLAKKMQTDGIVPLAFGDKDGWPAMGTFDILNMRINGYQFHIDLMAGNQKWTDPKVKAVFQKWAELLPFFQPGALGRTWQDAAQTMISKQAGMYFLGTFVGEQAKAQADHDDLDFFPFPLFGNAYDAEMAIDAPIDGFMVSAKVKNLPGAKAFMEYLGTGEAGTIFVTSSPNNIAAAKDAVTSGYVPFQKKMAEIIGGSKAIAQFLDRDTRPDFAGANGMQSFLQTFISKPSQDLDAFLSSVQKAWDILPPYGTPASPSPS